MRGAGKLGLGGVGVEELGAEFGEINFLGVGRALGVWTETCQSESGGQWKRPAYVELTFLEDHRASQVLDRLLDDIVQDPHHRDCLFLAEPLGAQPADKLQGVEVVVACEGR